MYYIELSEEGFTQYTLWGISFKDDPLDGSIEKWEYIVDWLEQNPDSTLDDGQGLTCPLCHLYNHNFVCTRCPISKHTGRIQCYGTPYHRYRNDYSLDAARDMVDFLHAVKEAQ